MHTWLETTVTTALNDPPPTDGWTTADLDALPEDGVRRELLDGVLLVSPCATDIHQIIAMRLMVALEADCPADLQVTQNNEVRISSRRSFQPDVLVTTDEAGRRRGHFFAPHEVALVVEIVSPTTVSMDRITKPALYAAAGIPFFWRIETDGGFAVHAYKLDPVHVIYGEPRTFTDVIDLEEPFRIGIPLARLRPRHL